MKHIKKQFNVKELVALFLWVIFSIIIQYALITSFISEGLNDITSLEISFFGGLQISISILFHLIPLNVILILASSWLYLTRNLFTVSFKAPIGAKARISGKSSDLATRIRPLRFTFLSALSIILLFGFLSFIILVLICPFFLYNLVTNLYENSSLFRSLIELSKQINLSLINAIGTFAIAFRNNLWDLIKPISEPIITLNVTWKYLICQNIAAWLTAITILAYVRYYIRERKRAA